MEPSWIAARTTSLIRQAELLSENGEHNEADDKLQQAIEVFELAADRLREAQRNVAAARLSHAKTH